MSKEIDRAIASANLNAYGWKIGNHIHSTPFTSHVFYIRDYRDNQIHLVTVGQKDFDSARVNQNIPISSHVNAIGQLIKKCSKKGMSQKDAGGFSLALVGYIKNTGSYRQWITYASADERMHVVINLYGQKNGLIMLRPFILSYDELMLTPADVTQYTDQVNSMDKKQHPKWFK